MTAFRVWAPAAGQVEVQALGDWHPMSPAAAAGWWEADVGRAPGGTDYAFRLDGGPPLPDPRSPWQPSGPQGVSRSYDHSAFRWGDRGWRGTPLHGSVIYELHLGTFTPEGTFDAAIERLDHLRDLGMTMVELMPVAAFPGRHGWGYDGTNLWAVHEPYGGPDGLKRFVDACHARRLAVLLDVVYNHLGIGNHLAEFGPYFTDAHVTPWGPAVNLDQPGSDEVREFLIDNARMWLRDYHIDGLRLDAVHALEDHRALHFLEQLADEMQALAAQLDRELVLIAESDGNDPRLVTSREAGGYGLAGQWSDDFHHAVHAALTGERQGYYGDFGSLAALAKTLTKVFFHDGSWSSFRGRSHGRPVDVLRTPAHRFLGYLQDHDQVGNRATGDRISAQLPRRPAQGRRGADPDRAVHADAVHGGGVGGGHPVAVLHRSHRPRAGQGRRGRPPGGVRRLWLGRRRHPGPAGRGDLPAIEAGLVGTGPSGPPRAARLVPGADRAAPPLARADRPAARPGACQL